MSTYCQTIIFIFLSRMLMIVLTSSHRLRSFFLCLFCECCNFSEYEQKTLSSQQSKWIPLPLQAAASAANCEASGGKLVRMRRGAH